MRVELVAGLEREWRGEVWVVPQKEIVLAPVAGRVVFLVQDGQWVAPGAILAEITGSEGRREVVYCPCGGMVVLQPSELRPRAISGLWGRMSRRRDGEQVESGMELACILRPGIACLRLGKLPFQLPSSLETRTIVGEIRSAGGITALQWYEAKLENHGDRSLSLYVADFPMEWLNRETLSVVVRITGPAGQRIPVTAIACYKGHQGVFVITQLGYEFRRLEVLDRVGQNVVVSGLAVGDQVVTRPQLLTKR
ncbi:MAG: hypothetical protein GX998_05665 [Firmicutes bacterium]|nr:hypothetical protein [Bacillota bacterium]